MLFNPQLIPTGQSWPITTRARAITQNIPVVIQIIMTDGYAVSGDGGGAEYKRVAVQPVHAGKFQSNDGAWWELCSLDINVKMFGAKGDNATNDRQAFVDALGFADIVNVPVGNYRWSASITIPSNKTLIGPGTIKPIAAAYPTNYLILIDVGSSNIKIGVKFDGANMPVPVAAWTGVGAGTARSPVGSAIFINGTSAVSVDVSNITLDGAEFINFPSGPVCAFYTNNFVIRSCRTVANQTYVANETNALFHMHGCTNSVQRDNYNSGFNWKAFYFGNCIGCQCLANRSFGGVAGHAAFFTNGGNGITFSDNTAYDAFGMKLDNTANVSVNGFTSINSLNGGFYIQGGSDINVNGLRIQNPTNLGILLETAPGQSDLTRITITNWLVDRAAPGAAIAQSAIFIQGDAVNVVSDVRISNGACYNNFFGVRTANNAAHNIDGVIVENNSFNGCVQYSILLYCKRGSILNNYVNTAYVGIAIQVYSQANIAGIDLNITGNEIYLPGGAATGINVGSGGAAGQCRFNVVNVTGNIVHGGNLHSSFSGNNNATDLVKVLNWCNNIGFDNASANAIDIIANATNVTPCSTLTGNTLVNTAGARKNIRVQNSVAITNKVDSGNNVGAVSYV